ADTCIYIDEETFIGPGVCIEGPGNIKIGKRCMIAAHSGIYANSHNFANSLEPIKHQGVTRKGIVIEDDCWIGHGVTVLDGVTIGQGSVIGAGTVVNKNVPPLSVAVGVPARVIKSRISQSLWEEGVGISGT
ncbi:acyltransferase, partial [Blastomonas sp.]